MPSAVVALALRDAVAGALNDPVGVLGLAAPGWSQAVTAETCYAPDLELKDVADLRVLVAWRARRQSLLTRASSQVDIEVAIGVFKRVGDDPDTPDGFDQDEVAALLLLCQEFEETLYRFRVASPPFQVFAVESAPVYDPDMLATQRRFEALIVLTFRGSR
jgi:hypothetical protein